MIHRTKNLYSGSVMKGSYQVIPSVYDIFTAYQILILQTFTYQIFTLSIWKMNIPLSAHIMNFCYNTNILHPSHSVHSLSSSLCCLLFYLKISCYLPLNFLIFCSSFLYTVDDITCSNRGEECHKCYKTMDKPQFHSFWDTYILIKLKY
jgi:hypothetical protein